MKKTGPVLILTVLVAAPAASTERLGSFSLGTAFTYQGRLHEDERPAEGVFDLEVACCNNASLNGGGMMVLHGFLQELAFDNDTIQSRGIGASPYQFTINPQGGNVGIGVASPQAPLHLPGAPDVTPSSGGALVIGSVTGRNVAFDQNEIMARNNGAVATLFLNPQGGNVQAGGNLYVGGGVQVSGPLVVLGPSAIGYEIVESFGFASAVVSCPAGKQVVGGGCVAGFEDLLVFSYPFSEPGNSGWACAYENSSTVVGVRAICANVT